ncbi:chromosome partitioning protein ParB [Spirochaetia bacterium]|nr:chromosome partitioning protein ParB [Spirochaetia bacterium]
MAPKQRLGKGLDALFPLDEQEAFPIGELSRLPAGSDRDAGGVGSTAGGAAALVSGEHMLPLDRLIANPNQPRKRFDEDSLRELADSIREHGIIQPILAEDAGDGTYIIIAGERRYRAARMAGLTEVPILVRAYSDEKRMEVSLIENIQRSDLNPIEEASAYRQLMELTGLSQDEVAARVGKNRSTVANTLRLLKLPPPITAALAQGELSPGHGRALLAVNESADQETLFREILARGLSVRETEKRAAAFSAPPDDAGRAGAGKKRDPELAAIEERFIKALGTKVVITGDFSGGSIRVDYYSMEDLERLLEILG